MRDPVRTRERETARMSFTYGRKLNHFVGSDCLGFLVYCVSNALRSRPAIRDVVFDTKVSIWATRVVASGKEDTPSGFVLPNDIGSRRGGKD